MPRTIIRSAVERIKWFLKCYIQRDPFSRTLRDWYRSDGDTTLRVQYELDDKSVVFDVGGYKGDWAQKILELYGCSIYVFEPIPEYYDVIRDRFVGSEKVKVFPFGLAEKTEHQVMQQNEDGSSIFCGDGTRHRVQLVDVVAFVREQGIQKIDLIKINIEGAEYALLLHMLESDIIGICGDIQIQFHNFIPDAVAKREWIRMKLRATHDLTYDFPFIWENWKIRKAS